MKLSVFYRVLLRLYPAEFRAQFSEEMFRVFEQRAGERFACKSACIAFSLMEFSGILKGAYTMWLAKIFSSDRRRSSTNQFEPASANLSVSELMDQRQVAINKMVAAIARHDFINARRYSDEEGRLQSLLQTMQNQLPVAQQQVSL